MSKGAVTTRNAPATLQRPGARHQETNPPVRINRTRHTANFTTLPNAVLRHPRLSLTAVGLLGRLLSLPDGSRETVQTLSAKVQEGRLRVRKAMAELEEEGFLRRVRHQDQETGLWSTDLHVYDTPADQDPAAGEPGGPNVGRSPKGVSTSRKETSPKTLPSPSVDQAPAPAAPAREGIQETNEHHTEAARILARLEAVDGRLKLSQRAVQALVPLASRWLQNGATVAEITDAVAQGLPDRVYSAHKLVADRLTRKLPAPRRAWTEYADCADCRNPLPVGQSSGICGTCAGVVPHPDLQALVAPGTPDPAVTAVAASIRSAIRAARSATA